MRLKTFIKKLQELEKTVGPMAYVVVKLEGYNQITDYTHWGISGVDYQTIQFTDPNTGENFNKDGSEKVRTVVEIL